MSADRTTAGCDEMPPVIPSEFRAAMRRLAAGVTVVTSRNEGVLTGMTATAVCSVSAEPPTVLVAVNRDNRSHPAVAASGVFAVHVLGRHQHRLASLFASKVEEPFAGLDFDVGVTGCPLLAGADACCECVVVQSVDAGTHTLFVGRVVASDAGGGEPLVYHSGGYRHLGGTVAG